MNTVHLIGNLGADPEVRTMPSGESVANLRVATTEKWKNKDGVTQERTDWHTISFFGRRADVAGQYASKGDTIAVTGKLQYRKWEAQDGSERISAEIRGDSIELLGRRDRSGQKQPEQGPQSKQRQYESHQKAQEPPAELDAFEDDIPFS